MDDFLTKPISKEKLTKTLQKWLGNTDTPALRDESANDLLGATGLEPIWDEAATLNSLENDGELLSEMSGLFLADIPSRLAELENALARNELSVMESAAHAIKGMAKYFFAEQLVSHAANLEHAARSGEAADFQQMTKNLLAAAAGLTQALEQRLGKALISQSQNL
jgi:HPt (histidine-containing phosphotransfer) domain-containing protein